MIQRRTASTFNWGCRSSSFAARWNWVGKPDGGWHHKMDSSRVSFSERAVLATIAASLAGGYAVVFALRQVTTFGEWHGLNFATILYLVAWNGALLAGLFCPQRTVAPAPSLFRVDDARTINRLIILCSLIAIVGAGVL